MIEVLMDGMMIMRDYHLYRGTSMRGRELRMMVCRVDGRMIRR